MILYRADQSVVLVIHFFLVITEGNNKRVHTLLHHCSAFIPFALPKFGFRFASSLNAEQGASRLASTARCFDRSRSGT